MVSTLEHIRQADRFAHIRSNNGGQGRFTPTFVEQLSLVVGLPSTEVSDDPVVRCVQVAMKRLTATQQNSPIVPTKLSDRTASDPKWPRHAQTHDFRGGPRQRYPIPTRPSTIRVLDKMDEFDGKVALITGASRGLGFAVSKALAKAGAQVLALARTVGALEELDDTICADGGPKPVLIPQDITEQESLAGLTGPLADRFGRIDLWIHTAVYAPPLSPAEHMDPRDLERAISTNLTAVQGLILAVDPLLRRSKSGQAVFFHDPVDDGFHAAYLAGKSGAEALVRAWGKSLSRTSTAHVRVAIPPPMHTSVRGRFHPGEKKDALAHPRDVAARLLRDLVDSGRGDIDLQKLTSS